MMTKYKLLIYSVLMVSIMLTMITQILILKYRNISGQREIVEVIETETDNNGIVLLSVDDTIFQDSRIINLHLQAKGNPVRFDVSLESRNEKALLPVYSSPVPFDREDDGRKINYSLGEYPPNPLSMEIILPLEFEGLIKTTTFYNTWDPAVAPGEKPVSGDYFLLVTKSVDLEVVTTGTQG